MENTSKVILRNEGRLSGSRLLVVNPARDLLTQRLQRNGREVRLSSQDFGDTAWLQSAGFAVTFEAIPVVAAADSTVVMHLPREKGRLDMLLHAIADRLDPAGRLWLVGENRAGIRSAARHLEHFFGAVSVLDKARHCVLYEARAPGPERPFELNDYQESWSLWRGECELRLVSLPGVFAHGRLDPGSEQLLEALRPLRPGGRLLDFACGCGVIGLSLLQQNEALDLTLLDSSALALEACRRSMAANGLHAELLPSDGLAAVSGRYDWIVSNPPFHQGVRSDLRVAADFFRAAGTFLTGSGTIIVVFNRHLPYLRWLRESFATVERLDEDGEYTIARASRPAACPES